MMRFLREYRRLRVRRRFASSVRIGSMNVLRQVLVSALLLGAAIYIWIGYVPSARPLLQRVGLLDLLGIEMPDTAAEPDRAGHGGAAQVITAQVQERVNADQINAIGDGRARHSVDVRSKATGLITELSLEAGRRVEAGTIIARFEDEAENISLDQARVRLEDASDEAARIARLQGTGAVTEVRMRESQLALRNAELALRQAQFHLSQRQIEAPISGWVGIIDVEVGDRVTAQDILATITDRSVILIEFRVPERVVGKLRVGQALKVTPLGLRDLALQGQVSAIDTVVDRASRTLRVQGRVDNAKDLLRAGMAFSVSMTFPGRVLMSIEPLALQWSSDGPFVWAVRAGKAVSVPVLIRQRNSDNVLVESEDLHKGDAIVIEGVQSLREGADVTPVEQIDSAVLQAPFKRRHVL
ncbi:efflux RND transporter periplasmic adaptor subunit [Sulfitobacter aestuarii]|uniref:Efflux RND transporter periplasmic adaptor subunit n=1 Tax=Sulfitobacter aestuarii TaxID=2161676 RepID=A0ABW5U6F3_9RHOB